MPFYRAPEERPCCRFPPVLSSVKGEPWRALAFPAYSVNSLPASRGPRQWAQQFPVQAGSGVSRVVAGDGVSEPLFGVRRHPFCPPPLPRSGPGLQ